MNLFEEFHSSHLRDELLMLLGFLSFKSFSVKNFGVQCVDVIDVVYCTYHLFMLVCKFYKYHANAKNSTWYQSLACEDTVKGHCCCLPRPWDKFC